MSFLLVVIGCAEALLAVVLLCAALRNRRQCADKKRSALRRTDEILLYNMDRQSNDVCLIMRQHDLLQICAAGDMQSLLVCDVRAAPAGCYAACGRAGGRAERRFRLEEMLQTQGFDPFTQSAAYYRLTGDAPEANTVEVSVQNASRDAVYAPASMEKVTDGDVHERRYALLKGRGLFGTRNYTVTEVSGTQPSELMVAENWVSSPQTEEQTAYAEAESIYRSFVYDAYTAADEDLLPVLNRLFWQDYDDENDGVYSALSRIREVLKAQVRYSETAEATPDNADPIAYFLTDSRKGNAVLYASATVQALRAHGIPARYAERRRRRMSIEERVRQSQKLMFKLISLWGIDAALGWETAATDKALADTLPSVKPGEYERVNGLLENTIYGGIALEPFEERVLDLFVQRLWGRNVKKSWKMRLKLRYACLLTAK